MADLFDYEESLRLKYEGMDRAEAKAATPLEEAREIARRIALKTPDRCVSADDVGRELKRLGLPFSLGPATGSLFRGKEWEFTGRRIKSRRTSNHAREIKVWRLNK